MCVARAADAVRARGRHVHSLTCDHGLGNSAASRCATWLAEAADGIRDATPGFSCSNPTQAAANVLGSAVSSRQDLQPLVEK